MSTLKRTLGLRDITLLLVGNVIGSGIFLTPGGVLRDAGGRPGVALFVWALGGVLSLLGALTYAELAARHPRAGGLYVYIRDAFGTMPAFLFGWTMFFAVVSGTVAALAVAVAEQAQGLVAMSPLGQTAVAALVIVVITALNALSTRSSADVLNTTTLLKTGVLVVLGVVLLARGEAPVMAPGPVPEGAAASLLTAVGVAMMGVLWSYEGWQYTTFSSGEVEDAPRRLPKALVLGTLLLTGVYLLTNLGYLAALGAGGVMASERVASDGLAAVGLGGLSKALLVVILVSVFSAANATLLSGTRIFYAMAQDRLFFDKMQEVHPRFQTPLWAVVGTGVWTLLLALSGTFNQLLTYVIFCGFLFYAMAAAALFVYRRRGIGDEATYRTPLYPVVPALFILLTLGLMVSTIVDDPTTAIYGFLVVATGVPAYLFWRRRSVNAAGGEAKPAGPPPEWPTP